MVIEGTAVSIEPLLAPDLQKTFLPSLQLIAIDVNLNDIKVKWFSCNL